MKTEKATKITTLIAVVLTILKIAGVGGMSAFKWVWIILIWLSPLALCLCAFLVYLIFRVIIVAKNKIK